MMVELSSEEHTERRPKPPGPSVILQAFNFSGLVTLSSWYAGIPFWSEIDPDLRARVLSLALLPLLFGHLYLWNVIRRMKQRAGP